MNEYREIHRSLDDHVIYAENLVEEFLKLMKFQRIADNNRSEFIRIINDIALSANKLTQEMHDTVSRYSIIQPVMREIIEMSDYIRNDIGVIQSELANRMFETGDMVWEELKDWIYDYIDREATVQGMFNIITKLRQLQLFILQDYNNITTPIEYGSVMSQFENDDCGFCKDVLQVSEQYNSLRDLSVGLLTSYKTLLPSAFGASVGKKKLLKNESNSIFEEAVAISNKLEINSLVKEFQDMAKQYHEAFEEIVDVIEVDDVADVEAAFIAKDTIYVEGVLNTVSVIKEIYSTLISDLTESMVLFADAVGVGKNGIMQVDERIKKVLQKASKDLKVMNDYMSTSLIDFNREMAKGIDKTIREMEKKQFDKLKIFGALEVPKLKIELILDSLRKID